MKISKPIYVLKGFFNEYVKDEFEDARSKIHQIMLRTVCELKIHNATSCLFTSSYVDYDLVFGCNLANEDDLVSNMTSH